MQEIKESELREIQMDMASFVDEICRKHNLEYSLGGGTLLGAIRHGGYIPWDDDIDLGMLRPDYDRFMATFNGYNPRYRFSSAENDPESFTHFGKVFDTSTILYEPDEKGTRLSVYVDIFPMDNAPLNVDEQKKILRRRDIYTVCNLGRKLPVFLKPTRGGVFHVLAVYAFRAVLRVFPRHWFVRKLVENARSCKDDTGLVGDFTGLRNAVYPAEYLRTVTAGEFEGKSYNLPAGWDGWLKALYGDYMTLPPETERVSTHKFKAYWKD